MQTIEGKPMIEYPTMWEYRLIGSNKEKLKALIARVMSKPYEFKEGQNSSGGKFVSVIVRVDVESEVERDHIFKTFQEDDEVKMVL